MLRLPVNHPPWSRVREDGMHGSEGEGAGVTTGSSYPCVSLNAYERLYSMPLTTQSLPIVKPRDKLTIRAAQAA